MAPRRTRAKDLSRKTAIRPERRTVVIFCEGSAAEPDYLKAVKALPQVRSDTSINIEIDPEQGVPMTLVENAVRRKRCDDEVDEFWCVFDVEWPVHHPNLANAIERARAHGISLAISNPCFDLWLILHLADHTAFIENNDAAKSGNRRLARQAGSRIDPAMYMPHLSLAADRALALTKRHERNGTSFPDDNPSSTMYRLLAAIRALPATYCAEPDR